MLANDANGRSEVPQVGLDLAIGDGIGLRNADKVGGVEFEAVVALDAVNLVGSVGRVDEVFNTYSAVGNLSLAICKVAASGRA